MARNQPARLMPGAPVRGPLSLRPMRPVKAAAPVEEVQEVSLQAKILV